MKRYLSFKVLPKTLIYSIQELLELQFSVLIFLLSILTNNLNIILNKL